MPPPRSPTTEKKRPAALDLGVLIPALALGAVLAAVAMPAIYRQSPTDLTRVTILLEALRQPDPKARIAILGSSVAMSAVNGRRLSESLEGAPAALHLGTTGQGLAEAYLLAQALPDSIRTVVLLLSPRILGASADLTLIEFNAFAMADYEPDARTREELSRISRGRLAEVLDVGPFVQRFAARWVVRQYADAGARRYLRPDLALERALYDLSFPQPYTEPMPPEAFTRALARRHDSIERQGKRPPGEGAALLAALATRLVESGRELLIVIEPTHSALRGEEFRDFDSEQVEFLDRLARKRGVSVLSLVDAVPADAFVDAIHLSSAGAEIATARIAEKLSAP